MSTMKFTQSIARFLLILSLIGLCSGAGNSSRKRPATDNKECPLVSLSCAGQPGTNGIPGIHGLPGPAGRDGRDGSKGEMGGTGKTGPQGPPGDQGKEGTRGEPGLQGPTGQKGERGEKGQSGVPETPYLSSYVNWKECTWGGSSHKDSGEIKNCMFIKNFTDTSLHVYFNGNLRVAGCDDCCSRWYFTFNGAECSSPGTIDGAFYMKTGRNHDLHRHRHIEGHCNNIQKGKVRVGFWVGQCVTHHRSADAFTGWHSMSRIFVEEVSMAQL